MHWTLSHPSSSTPSDWPVSWHDTNTCFVEVLLDRYRALSIKSRVSLISGYIPLAYLYRTDTYCTYTYRNAHKPSVLRFFFLSAGLEGLIFTLPRQNLRQNLSPLPTPILMSQGDVCRRPRRQYKMMKQQKRCPRIVEHIPHKTLTAPINRQKLNRNGGDSYMKINQHFCWWQVETRGFQKRALIYPRTSFQQCCSLTNTINIQRRV